MLTSTDFSRYLNPPNHWVYCELESKELLALCIKKVRGLNKVKLVDAGFVWTVHSGLFPLTHVYPKGASLKTT